MSFTEFLRSVQSEEYGVAPPPCMKAHEELILLRECRDTPACYDAIRGIKFNTAVRTILIELCIYNCFRIDCESVIFAIKLFSVDRSMVMGDIGLLEALFDHRQTMYFTNAIVCAIGLTEGDVMYAIEEIYVKHIPEERRDASLKLLTGFTYDSMCPDNLLMVKWACNTYNVDPKCMFMPLVKRAD